MGRKIANYTHQIIVQYGSAHQEEYGEQLIEVFINAWKDHMENNHKGNKIRHVVKSFNEAKEKHER